MSEKEKISEDQKGYKCEIILDSVNPAGVRLTTMRVKYPLMIHAEFCRHRCFSRSVSSNRAIPTAKIIAMVEQDPVIPIYWGKNKAGMQAEEELNLEEQQAAQDRWFTTRNFLVYQAQYLQELGVHKQIVNRLLAPFQWVTEVITGTDWANFFALRCHEAAQPEIRKIAEMIRDARNSSEPQELCYGGWHLPFISYAEKDYLLEFLLQISAARCARTSYRTHDQRISTIEEDTILFKRLAYNSPPHSSPCEHQACAQNNDNYIRNFRGWKQFRTEIDNETVFDI